MGGLNNRGWKSEIKVLAGLVHSEGCDRESVSSLLAFGGFLTSFDISWCVDLPICVSEPKCFLFYKDTSRIGLETILFQYDLTNYICNDSISK